MKFLILAILAWMGTASREQDQEHMARCMPATRRFVSEGGDAIEWLLEQAKDDIDVVLLYLLRMCYFDHVREDSEYSMNTVYAQREGAVESFTDYEFALLTAAINEEQANRSLYERIMTWGEANEENAYGMGNVFQLTGLLAVVFVPLYVMRTASSRRIKKL